MSLSANEKALREAVGAGQGSVASIADCPNAGHRYRFNWIT